MNDVGSSLVMLILLLLVFGVPYLLVMRILWHAGSWFKRKDRHNDWEV